MVVRVIERDNTTTRTMNVPDVVKALRPLIKDQAIRSPECIPLFVKTMQQCQHNESRRVMILVLEKTPENILKEFLESEGWTLLFMWLKKASDEESNTVLIPLLKVLTLLPVTLDLLQTVKIGKQVAKLRKKTELSEASQLANAVFEKWASVIAAHNESVQVETTVNSDSSSSTSTTSTPIVSASSSSSSSSSSLKTMTAAPIKQSSAIERKRKPEEPEAKLNLDNSKRLKPATTSTPSVRRNSLEKKSTTTAKPTTVRRPSQERLIKQRKDATTDPPAALQVPISPEKVATANVRKRRGGVVNPNRRGSQDNIVPIPKVATKSLKPSHVKSREEMSKVKVIPVETMKKKARSPSPDIDMSDMMVDEPAVSDKGRPKKRSVHWNKKLEHIKIYERYPEEINNYHLENFRAGQNREHEMERLRREQMLLANKVLATIPWLPPRRLEVASPLFLGTESQERGIQATRQRQVVADLYNPRDIPPSPREPENKDDTRLPDDAKPPVIIPSAKPQATSGVATAPADLPPTNMASTAHLSPAKPALNIRDVDVEVLKRILDEAKAKPTAGGPPGIGRVPDHNRYPPQQHSPQYDAGYNPQQHRYLPPQQQQHSRHDVHLNSNPNDRNSYYDDYRGDGGGRRPPPPVPTYRGAHHQQQQSGSGSYSPTYQDPLPSYTPRNNHGAPNNRGARRMSDGRGRMPRRDSRDRIPIGERQKVPCKYFGSAKGCERGQSCHFRH